MEISDTKIMWTNKANYSILYLIGGGGEDWLHDYTWSIPWQLLICPSPPSLWCSNAWNTLDWCEKLLATYLTHSTTKLASWLGLLVVLHWISDATVNPSALRVCTSVWAYYNCTTKPGHNKLVLFVTPQVPRAVSWAVCSDDNDNMWPCKIRLNAGGGYLTYRYFDGRR